MNLSPKAGRLAPPDPSLPRIATRVPTQKIVLPTSGSLPPARKGIAQNGKKVFPVLKPLSKVVFAGDEEKVCRLIAHALELDGERRMAVLRSISFFLTQHTVAFSPDGLNLFISLLTSILMWALPFTVVEKGYRKLYFTTCVVPADVNLCYDLFPVINGCEPEYPDCFLRALVRRLASASVDDRARAQVCISCLPQVYVPKLLHLIAMGLSSVPHHGVGVMLDCLSRFLDISCSCNSRLCLEIERVLCQLHLAPHLRTFHDNLIFALKSLHAKDENIAHRNRRFLLRNWPRLEPRRALLFMQEATAICVTGPPIEVEVWKRFSWRSSCIQWQIAMEGLSFVDQTIELVPEAADATLRFLLEEAATSHWSAAVRDQSRDILSRIPDIAPTAPRMIKMDTWNQIKETAKAHFPGVEFGSRRHARR
jgi:hypothetical protein